ncbi:MAG: cupin domain-containing protein [Eubacteriales bacterium]|nr:cupin domain-containing protein [Eubacteriales bacterium]
MYQYEWIGRINNNALSVVQVENRTLDFHAHEQSDELFLILEGELTLETGDGLLPLNAGEMVIIPCGMRRRPIIAARVKLLLMEYDTISKP